jgi:hypothetical protein
MFHADDSDKRESQHNSRCHARVSTTTELLTPIQVSYAAASGHDADTGDAVVRILLALILASAVASLCHGARAVDNAPALDTQQMVFMLPVSGAQVPDATATYEVALMNFDGSQLRQLTRDGAQKFLPHLSADGTRVIYTRFSAGGYGDPNGKSDIASYDQTASTETLLTHNGGASQATFSPDETRIAYGAGALTKGGDGALGLYVMNANGSNPHRVAVWSGSDDDVEWGDYAWSSDDWILFTVKQTIGGCFKVRLDKIRPDGTSRTQVTDGGPNCTPPGMEQSGDADPGWSEDASTIYSSRGFPVAPAGAMAPVTERKLYAFSSDAWYPGKPETDLSLMTEPDCIEGVPKGSPDGNRVLLFRACFQDGVPLQPGIYLTDANGSYRTFVASGFGPDWNNIHNAALDTFPLAGGGAPWAYGPSERVTIVGYDGNAMEPFLSRDGRYLLFNNSNDAAVDTNLHYAERVDDLTFTYKGEIRGVNTPALDAVATLDRNGTLYFVSTRSYDQTLSTIYRGQFLDGQVTNVELVAGISKLQAGSVNFDVDVSADGNTLYFVDGVFANGTLLTARLAIALRSGSAFTRAPNSDHLLQNVNSSTMQYAACSSADALHLFFTKVDADGPHIYQSVRESISEPFSQPVRVANVGGFVEAPALSAGESSLYFHRKDADQFSIYRVARYKPIQGGQPRIINLPTRMQPQHRVVR